MAPKRTARLLFKGDLPDGRRYELVVLGERVLLEFYCGTRRLNKVHVPKESGIEWAAERLGVAVEDIPQGLVDALRSAGENHLSYLPQVLQVMMAIILNPCRLMIQLQVRSVPFMHRTPRTHGGPCPTVRAKSAFTSISCFSCTSVLHRSGLCCNSNRRAVNRCAATKCTADRRTADRRAATGGAASSRATGVRAAANCRRARSGAGRSQARPAQPGHAVR